MQAGQVQEGLIRAVSAADMQTEERALTDIPLRHRDSLAALVEDAFVEARNHRQGSGIDGRIKLARLTRDGKYPEAKLAVLQEAGVSTEYARLTANKGRLIMAWLADIYADPSEFPWKISPPEFMDMPPEYEAEIVQATQTFLDTLTQAGVQPDAAAVENFKEDQEALVRSKMRKEARKDAERINRIMATELRNGGFEGAMLDFLHDFVFFPAAIIKAPTPKYKEKAVLEEGEVLSDSDVVLAVERVDPSNIYPSPDAVTLQDGYIIEMARVTYQDLLAMRDMDDVDTDAIRDTLRKARDGSLDHWIDNVGSSSLPEIPTLTLTQNTLPGKSFDALEYHGPLFGSTLKEWGVSGIDEEEVYEAAVLVIDGRAIRATINDDPLRRRPYFKASYENIAGSFWGASLTDVLQDIQHVANASIRSLVNNMSMASGPQAVVNIDNLPDGEPLTTLTPWRVWQVSSAYNQATANTIQFFQPNSNAGELLTVFNRMYELADELSMTPRIMSGESMGTLGRTASGMSMVMSSASKGLKRLVYAIDSNVLTPMIRRYYHELLGYGDIEPPVFGVDIKVTGASGVLHEDTLQLRRNEFLQITANQIDSQIVGVSGRAAILKEVAKNLELDLGAVFGEYEARERQLEQQAQQAQMTQQPAPQQGNAPSTPADPGQQLPNGAPVTDNFSPNTLTT